MISGIVTATDSNGETSMESLPVGPVIEPPIEEPPPEDDSEPTVLPSRAARAPARTKRRKR
jgi:hypothetical protein